MRVLLLIIILCVIIAVYEWYYLLPLICTCFQRVQGGSQKKKQKTYYLRGVMDYSTLEEKLNKDGWIKANIKDKFIDFIIIDGAYDEKYSHISYKPSILKNTLNSHDIRNKWITYNVMLTQYPEQDYLPISYLKHNFPMSKANKPYIIRPVNGWVDKGMFDKETTKKVLEDMKNISQSPQIDKLRDIMPGYSVTDRSIFVVKKMTKEILNVLRPKDMISEYIMDLDTIDGKIYHVRVYLIVAYIKGTKHAYMSKTMPMYTAKNKWSKDTIDHADIHDSHVDSTSTVTYMKNTKTMKRIYEILTKVYKTFSKTFVNYKETENSFRIHGCDFMVRKNGKVMFIEANGNPGFKGLNASGSYKMNLGIYKSFILPVFYNKDPEPYDNWVKL